VRVGLSESVTLSIVHILISQSGLRNAQNHAPDRLLAAGEAEVGFNRLRAVQPGRDRTQKEASGTDRARCKRVARPPSAAVFSASSGLQPNRVPVVRAPKCLQRMHGRARDALAGRVGCRRGQSKGHPAICV
jgi:hypothetical protein